MADSTDIDPRCLVEDGYDWCDGYQALIDRYGRCHDDRAHLIAEVKRLREGIRQHREAWRREVGDVQSQYRFDRDLWALLEHQRVPVTKVVEHREEDGT